MVVVLNGKEQKLYHGAGNLVFSPDSSHFAYSANMNNKLMQVIDGIESINKYVRISEVVFDSSNSLHYLAIKNFKDNEVYLITEQIEK